MIAARFLSKTGLAFVVMAALSACVPDQAMIDAGFWLTTYLAMGLTFYLLKA